MQRLILFTLTAIGLLAGLTFVAVYREVFETVLFFQALAAQAGPEGRGALVAGNAASRSFQR